MFNVTIEYLINVAFICWALFVFIDQAISVYSTLNELYQKFARWELFRRAVKGQREKKK